MITVDFSFYKEKYFGTLIEEEQKFRQPIVKANTYLKQNMYMNPSEEDMELVKLCLCEVAEMIYQDDVNKREHGGREIQSENTDGYSVSYATEAEAGKIAVVCLCSACNPESMVSHKTEKQCRGKRSEKRR